MTTDQFQGQRIHFFGQRAFLLILLRKMKIPLIFFCIAALATYASSFASPDVAPWIAYAGQVTLVAAIALTVLLGILAYIEYRANTYTFSNEAFVMTTGIAMRKEVAALYHQIQNVNINRSPMNRLLGVSEVIIFMTGADRDSEHSMITLPAIARHKAKMVQQELLSRARRHFSQGGQIAESRI